MRVRLLLILLTLPTLLSLPGSAPACLWDRNTLAAEIQGLPDVVQIITGRFERSPPLYYAMRLERVRKEIAAYPDKWELYDDAGVACDRLGRDIEAIGWMLKKRSRLPPLTRADANAKEHWYRCYANLGTFRVHSWIRSGADIDRLDEVREARGEIAFAVRLNPAAHFGREKVQQAIMNWIASPRVIETDYDGKKTKSFVPLSVFLGRPDESTRKGLIGLIALGNAWESTDSFLALAGQTNKVGMGKVAEMALLRVGELKAQGKHSLRLDMNFPDTLDKHYELSDGAGAEIQKQYAVLRKEADDWQTRRTAYMVTRLKAGRHPDTDPTFWNDWHDSGPPVVHSPFSMENFFLDKHPEILTALILAVPLSLLAGLIFAGRKLLKVRRERIAALTTEAASVSETNAASVEKQ